MNTEICTALRYNKRIVISYLVYIILYNIWYRASTYNDKIVIARICCEFALSV